MGWEGLAPLLVRSCAACATARGKLSAALPDVALEDLRLRRRAWFVHESDLNLPWRHELHLEDCVERHSGRSYPFCVQGHAPCPPEEVGGPEGYQARREAWLSWEAMEDLSELAKIAQGGGARRPARPSGQGEARGDARHPRSHAGGRGVEGRAVLEESRERAPARWRAPRPHGSAVVTPGRSRAIKARVAARQTE